MNLYPAFTPSQIAEQRWYLVLAIVLCLLMGAMIVKGARQKSRRLLQTGWAVLPFFMVFLLDGAAIAGVASRTLLIVFALHAGLILIGWGAEIKHSRQFLWVAVPLLVLFFNVALLPSVSTPRWVARLSHCKNNMKQLGLAVHNSDEADVFHPVTGQPPMSWRVKILPYLDSRPLGEGYDPSQEWDSPSNRQVGMREPPPYRCPAHRENRIANELACTDYALLTGPDTIFPTPETELDFKTIGDGSSNTIMMVECAGQRIPWTEPRDVDVSRVRLSFNELSPDGGSPSVLSAYDSNPSRESKWCHILLADGSVRRLDTATTDLELIRKLMTAHGGEPVGEF